MATPSRPSGPRVSGMIASGPASPARPTPPLASGKYVGVPITPPAAKGLIAPMARGQRRRAAEQAAEQIAEAAGRPLRDRLEALPPPARLDMPQRQRFEHVVELLAAGSRLRERARHGAGEAVGADAEAVGAGLHAVDTRENIGTGTRHVAVAAVNYRSSGYLFIKLGKRRRDRAAPCPVTASIA